MLTLKQLRYFEALSRLRHFGRAAQECAISQPALSMKIQELEARLGLALVERRRNGVKLTSAGDEIAQRARSILTSVRDLSDYARNAAGSLSGKLVLGAIPSIAPYLLPAALPLVCTRHPALELTLRETQTSILVAELLAGELDTILLSLPIEHPEIATLPLFTDRFVLAARSERASTGQGRSRPRSSRMKTCFFSRMAIACAIRPSTFASRHRHARSLRREQPRNPRSARRE